MPQSQTKSKIFPDELMIQTFGTVAPDPRDKHRYFFGKWMEWKENRSEINSKDHRSAKTLIRECLREYGLREYWDYQLRPYEIRFAKPEYLAIWRLLDDEL